MKEKVERERRKGKIVLHMGWGGERERFGGGSRGGVSLEGNYPGKGRPHGNSPYTFSRILIHILHIIPDLVVPQNTTGLHPPITTEL